MNSIVPADPKRQQIPVPYIPGDPRQLAAYQPDPWGPDPRQTQEREWFDLADLLRMYRRHMWPFLAVVVVCAAAAIAAAFVAPPRYAAAARVRIEPSQRAVLDTGPIGSQNFQTDQARIDTEVQLMRSADLARAVTRELQLWRDPAFRPKDLAAPAQPTEAQQAALVEQTARAVAANLDIRRNGNSYIVDLVYSAPTPRLAAQIANAFANMYVQTSGRLQSARAQEQSEWLQRQMTDLGAQVRSADARIADYRANTGIAQGGGGVTVTDQQIGPIAGQLATAQSEAARANGALQAARAQIASGALYSVSDVLNSTVITQLRQQRAQLATQQADLNARYGPNHPDVQRVAEQLRAVESGIQEEAARIAARLQADANAANSRVAALSGQLNQLRSQQASNTRAAVTAESLQRENDANRQIYERMIEQAQQTAQQAQVLQPNGTIVQAALEPTAPDFPDKKLFAAAGLLSGLMIGSVLVFALDFTRRGLRTPEDVTRLGAPFLGSVPMLTRRERRSLTGGSRRRWDAVVMKPMSGFAEAVRGLRATALREHDHGEEGMVVTMASSLPAEGKTHLAVSFAQTCAISGDRTIIIDCDMRRPQLHHIQPEPVGVGLTEVLEGKVPESEAIIVHPQTGLHVLPLAGANQTSKDLLGSERFQQLIADLRKSYDVVVLDSPPVLAVSSARQLARIADAVIYIAHWNKTPRGAIRSGLMRLRQDRTPVLGVALNMVDTSAQSSLSENDPAYYQQFYAAYYEN